MKRESFSGVKLEQSIPVSSKMDTCKKSEGIKHIPLCPEDIAKISTEQGVLSRNFQIYDYTSPFKKDLQVRGYVDYYGGYAEHTRQVIYRLAEMGKYNIKLTPIKTPVDVDVFQWQKNNWFIHNTINTDTADLMVIAGAGWLRKDFLPNNNRRVIGWTMIEGRKWSEECAEWLKNADHILCPTQLDMHRAKMAGVTKPIQARLGFDSELFNVHTKPANFVGLNNRFVFGVLGSWNVRKGVEDIVKAYITAFKKDDPVTLMLVCKYGTRPYDDPENGRLESDEQSWSIKSELDAILHKMNTDIKDCPHITVLDVPLHENVIANVMKRFNCLVGFSAGESTWLPGLQAMAMGIPVIQLASECNGFMEYMNDRNSYLCHRVNYEIAGKDLYLGTSDYYKGQEFAFGDFTELADKMLRIHRHPEESEHRAHRAWVDVEGWSWDKSISALDGVLMAI